MPSHTIRFQRLNAVIASGEDQRSAVRPPIGEYDLRMRAARESDLFEQKTHRIHELLEGPDSDVTWSPFRHRGSRGARG